MRPTSVGHVNLIELSLVMNIRVALQPIGGHMTAVTDTEPIQYEVADHVATIWLNRPHIKNAVNWDLLTQMAERVEEAAEDRRRPRAHLPRPWRHVLRRRGSEHALQRASRDQPRLAQARQLLGQDLQPIQTMDKPTISVVEGYAVAGGFELVISTDFAIAADNAQDRRLPHQARAVRRLRPDLPPAADHGPAQGQGADADAASC